MSDIQPSPSESPFWKRKCTERATSPFPPVKTSPSTTQQKNIQRTSISRYFTANKRLEPKRIQLILTFESNGN